MRVNIDCTRILLLLSGMLALLKIGGQFPYSWIWVIAPIWIPLLALAGITIILIIAWIIGVIVFGLRRPRPLGRGGSKPSSFHRLI
jgi:predicted histidine transporter YuiF (NhaC family)